MSRGLRGVTWDGRDAAGVRMPAGVYLARFRCGSATANVKLTIIPEPADAAPAPLRAGPGTPGRRIPLTVPAAGAK